MTNKSDIWVTFTQTKTESNLQAAIEAVREELKTLNGEEKTAAVEMVLELIKTELLAE